MPDFTYLQVSQPTTAGHWLLSFAAPALRDGERLRGDFAWVNSSPAGAGGVNGSRVPADRERLARDLGFDAVITHTRDAMWQADGLVELVSHATLAATTASRLAEDLEIYASEPFGFVRLAAEHCRASALMPQKRNPYALPVIRGAAGTLIGRAAGLAATQRTPSGRTDNLLYAYGETAGAVTLATGAVALAAAVVEGLELDAAALARPLHEGFAMAADLAEAVMLDDRPGPSRLLPRRRPRGGRARSRAATARRRSTRRPSIAPRARCSIARWSSTAARHRRRARPARGDRHADGDRRRRRGADDRDARRRPRAHAAP